MVRTPSWVEGQMREVLRVLGAGLCFVYNVLLARAVGVQGVGLDNAMLRFIAAGAHEQDWSAVKGVFRRGCTFTLVGSAVAAALAWSLAPWLAARVFSHPDLLRPLRFMALAVVPAGHPHESTQIPQLPVPEQKVHDQAQHQGGIAKNGTDLEMAKTAAQSLLQPQTQEELLDEDEPRERGQLAVLKTKLRKAMRLAVNFGSATLHRSGLLLGSEDATTKGELEKAPRSGLVQQGLKGPG